MVVIRPPPPDLSSGNLSLYYVVDELLARSPLLIFYGPSATATASANSSRVQAHIFSPAGLQSYPRLTVSPSSPLYAACNCLPREEQGDDVCRGLAFSIYKYFGELSDGVRRAWQEHTTALGREPFAPKLFSDAHAAILASRTSRVENDAEILQLLKQGLGEQTLSWIDMDVVLPPGSMKVPTPDGRASLDPSEEDFARQRYGGYASVVRLFGELAFLPTSRMRRAPSKPSGLSRSTGFSRTQKENLRREMCELLDTEESYVSKLHDLLHSVAEEFRQKSRSKGPDSTSPSSQALEKLFPPSLDLILEVNSQFLDTMRATLEATENDAITDIESTSVEALTSPAVKEASTDMTGAAKVAECLLEWLPKFTDCYSDYMQAHSNFPQYLRTFMQETESSFSKRVQETGEQRLMSMLIEPVQRLPRYNLYIDNIIKQLPLRHPAIKLFLRARDIISDICSRDDAPLSPMKIAGILEQITVHWPALLSPSGRLITAADVYFLSPPYAHDMHGSLERPGVLLLFTDCIIFLKKSTKQSMSARALLGRLDGSTVSVPDTHNSKDFEFCQQMLLPCVEFSELHNGSAVQFIDTACISRAPSRPGSRGSDTAIQVCALSGTYQGRSTKLAEEIAKARIEARFSETERESPQWEVRSMNSPEFNIFTSVYEQGSDAQHENSRGPPAKVRILVDERRGLKIVKAGENGIDILGSLTIQGEGFFKLEIRTPGEPATKDHLTSKEFLAVLAKRLTNILQSQNSINHAKLTPLLLTKNQHILQALNVCIEQDVDVTIGSIKEKSRAPSPVKMLTNLFGGSTPSNPSKHTRGAMSLSDVPRLAPMSMANSSDRALPSALSTFARPRFAIDHQVSSHEAGGLEQTLNSYVLALNARKGNIVGRVLLTRHQSSNEAAVNELYNTLLEDPSAGQIAAQAPVDVLFMAFEKFIKNAWSGKHGPILSKESLAALQSGSSNFEEVFITQLRALGSHSQAALRDFVLLLATLLEGTSNDGDRGVLTASFAEVLAPQQLRNPHELITILDRLVGHYDLLFGTELGLSESQKPIMAPTGLDHRLSKFGPTASDPTVGNGQASFPQQPHSSLRKKFGFGTIHRKANKPDEQEGASVWRTLSKSRSNTASIITFQAQGPSFNRSNSQDDREPRIALPKRPVSRDRSMTSEVSETSQERGAINFQSHNRESPRKKRRSSLSDLIELQSAMTSHKLDFQLPQSPRQTDSANATGPARISVPQRNASMRSVAKKENKAPQSALPRLTNPLSPPTSNAGAGIVRGSPNRPTAPRSARSSEAVSDHLQAISPSKRQTASGMPGLRQPSQALHERPNVTNIARFPPPDGKTASAAPTSPTRKLRMQSPQKLRERLANEAKVIREADDALAHEMASIGEELAAIAPGGRPGSSTSRPGTASSAGSMSFLSSQGSFSADPRFRALEARLKGLEATIPNTIASLSKRLTSVEADVSSSLTVSENKAKGLDELLRVAQAENEALYGRLDEQQDGLRAAVQTSADEQLRKQVASMQEEHDRLRKENARLKREVVGLRAQLKE